MSELSVTKTGAVSDAPRARVIRSLKQWIDEGTLPPGQVLPPERALAETLKVNRGTVRRALAALDDEGVLRSNGGRTRFVATPASVPATTSASRGLMEDAVAVLTPFGAKQSTQRQAGGWLEYISQGALWAVHEAGRHVIALHPERLKGSDVDRLAHEQPVGVVIPDTKMDFASTLEIATALQKTGIPLAIYGGSPELAPFDRVASDHEQGAYELARWLYSQGRRNILPVWTAPAHGYWYAQRYAGYKRAGEEADRPILPPIVVPPFPVCYEDKACFEAGVRHWVGYLFEHLNGANPVDALMMGTDSDVYGAAAACRLLGRTPNQDVALVGYDNYWDNCEERRFESITPLATVDKLNFEVGENLVRLLLDRVENRLPLSPQRRVVSPQMIVVEAREI